MSVILNNIAKTLLLPLKARAFAHQSEDFNFKDDTAYTTWKKTEVFFDEGTDFSFVSLMVARTQLFDRILREVVQKEKSTLVVNLGAGLCTRSKRFNKQIGLVDWLHIDVPEVISLRKKYLQDNISHLKALDLKNTNQWSNVLKEIFKTPLDQIVFMAEGGFSYFTAEEFTLFTEKIIEILNLNTSPKQVFICFDNVHPDYSFKSAFKKTDAFKEVSFFKNYKNIIDFKDSLTISPVVKKYRLPFAVTYSEAYQNFLTQNNGEEPYYAGCINLSKTTKPLNCLGTYFNKNLFLNPAYNPVFLENEMCLFWAKNDFQLLPTKEWMRLVFFLEDASSIENSFDEIQIYYAIEKLISLNILIEAVGLKYNNKPFKVEQHFFPNVWWSKNKFFKEILNATKEDICVFTHDLYDIVAQNYIENLLKKQKRSRLIAVEKTRVLVSPVFKNHQDFNLFVKAIEVNAPQLVWAKALTNSNILIPCPEEVCLSTEGFVWLQSQLQKPDIKNTIAEFINKTHKVYIHPIADYEMLQKTEALTFDKELIVDQSSGYRTKIASTILKDCKSQMNDVCGVISKPKLLANLQDKLVTYTCTYPTKIPFKTFEDKQFFNQSLGKGVHKQQSEISAIAEAIERFSMNFKGNEDVFVQGYNVVKKDVNYIDPLALCTFSETQYLKTSYKPLEQDLQLHWTSGFSITEKKEKFLPAVLTFQNAPYSERESLRFSSNGCATGNTVKEAILQGLLELVERDAVALWWYQKRECIGIDLEAHQDDVNILENEGWKVWVLEVTTDLEIPVHVAVAQSVKTEEYRLGFGSHLDPKIATARAISEVHQIIEVASFAKAEFDFSKIKKESYLFPKSFKKEEGFPKIKTIDEAIAFAQKKIENRGFELLYKNLSRSNLSLKTVKVFVPGLCFIWPEFGNLRLYKNRLGETKFTEQELNPMPLFV